MSGHAQRGGLAPLVLVADDEATQRLLTRDRLEREGYRVSEAPDGSAALEMMRTHPPAAVLLDINMPERDGFSVLAEARADSQLADVPIIVVTGLEDTQAIERAFSLQANDFITKPVVWSLLSHRLRFVLRADNMQHMLRDAMVAADAGNKAKSEFLANMSHELRTPLNAIIGFSEIMKGESSIALNRERYQEYAADIHMSGSHLLAIVNDILDLVKIESGAMVLSEDRFEISEVATQAVRLLETRAAERGVTVTNRIGDGAPNMIGDKRRINQILLNLLSNAVKFTPPGGGVGMWIEHAEDGGIAVAISDTGPGLRANDLPRLMEPFRQLDGSLSRQHEGTGLGVPIAQSLAKLHGGRLLYDTDRDDGTTVRLVLPPERVSRIGRSLDPDSGVAIA